MIVRTSHMRRQRQNAGFSVLELLVCMGMLIVVSGAALSALSYSTKMYRSQLLQSDMHANLRGTLALLTQEIGQAGSLNTSPKALAAAVTGSTSAQTVTLNSVSNLFVGEKLIVDAGGAQEIVQITGFFGTSQITGIFKKNHANAAPVFTQGVFAQGVLSSSTANSLKLFGDINADGSLCYVQYDYDSTAGTLSRSITTIAPGVTTRNASETLLTNLVANPGGTAFFQYGTAVNVTVNSVTYSFIPSVAVSVSIRTSKIDPQTHTYDVMTKSFSNLAARNVLAGLTLVQSSPAITNQLQPTPPGLPLGP